MLGAARTALAHRTDPSRRRGATRVLVAVLAAWMLVSAERGSAAAEYLYPYCGDDQVPRFVLGFAELKARLGPTMGEPIECEHADDETGDVSQRTSTGVAFWDKDQGARTFTAGFRHWTLVHDAISSWDGNASPSSANDSSGAFGGSAASGRAVAAYPLNGRFLLLNMHGGLFHSQARDFSENVAYARWMGAGVIRVFATDSNALTDWDGARVGAQIADMAPIFRSGQVKLVVALVNNHRPVPGEAARSSGWTEGYYQLLLPFYRDTWRDSYRTFLRSLIGTVRDRGALDVIQAWEIGNEIHTPESPGAIVPFVVNAVKEIRNLDPSTPIYPGTMGANHLQPWSSRSPIARWLYCEGPVDAYTLHAYDWVSRDRSGDMPIEWDLDAITAEPCPSGRQLPVIVEELGTSRALEGVYGPGEEERRLEQELRQLRFVLGFPQVRGIGAWSGESPRVGERAYYDNRRGLTSYGPGAAGGGSCYDPYPASGPGVRCRLERPLQALPTRP